MTYDPRLYGSTVVAVGAVSSELPARVNASGISLNKTDPVRIDASGQLQKIDCSVEAEVLACLGVARASAANGNSTGIVTGGRLEDVTVPGSLGDRLFLSKTGGLTNVTPAIGVGGFVAGDFVVLIGISVKNATNPSLTDLMVTLSVIAQL